MAETDLREAWRRLRVDLIVVSPRMTTPYTDEPTLSPWDRLAAHMRAVDDAISRSEAELAAAQARLAQLRAIRHLVAEAGDGPLVDQLRELVKPLDPEPDAIEETDRG